MEILAGAVLIAVIGTWARLDLDQLTQGQLLLIAAVVLVFIVVLRVNSYITQVKKLDKQQRKAIQTISALPCINKENATWLQDCTRNGGAPPSKVELKK